MVIAGADVIPGSSSSGGGGVTPKNYLAVENHATYDLTGSLVDLTLDTYNSQGSPGFALDAGNQKVNCTATGIYMVTAIAQLAVTGAVAQPINYARLQVNTANFADPNSLGALINPEQDVTVDQSQTLNVALMLTTAPMAIAAGDYFTVRMGMQNALGAGVTVALPSQSSLVVATVRLG